MSTILDNLNLGATMKAILAMATVAMVLALGMAACAGGQEWYQGGTLHNDTVKEWIDADEHNRLATSADWAAASFQRNNVTPNSMDVLRVWAETLKACITEELNNNASSQDLIVDLALICISDIGLDKVG